MSQQLELSNGTLLKLQAIADAKGVTPEEWIEAKVSEEASARALEEGNGKRALRNYSHVPGTSEDYSSDKERTLSEVLEGHIGILDSGASTDTQYSKDAYGEMILEKFAKQGIKKS